MKSYWQCTCAGLVLLSALLAQAQRGALVAPRSLDELTSRAETIVHGVVAAVRVEPHPEFSHLTTVVVTLNVQETLKGPAGARLEFRQYIWDVRDRFNAAGYRKGQELLLFLNPVSEYGLSSPVGLEQGRFRIVYDAQGRAQAVNGRNNAGLFRQTAQQAQARGVQLSARLQKTMQSFSEGPVALDDIREAVRGFAGKGVQP